MDSTLSGRKKGRTWRDSPFGIADVTTRWLTMTLTLPDFSWLLCLPIFLSLLNWIQIIFVRRAKHLNWNLPLGKQILLWNLGLILPSLKTNRHAFIFDVFLSVIFLYYGFAPQQKCPLLRSFEKVESICTGEWFKELYLHLMLFSANLCPCTS